MSNIKGKKRKKHERSVLLAITLSVVQYFKIAFIETTLAIVSLMLGDVPLQKRQTSQINIRPSS